MFTVCITAQDDGQYKVYTESEATEAAEAAAAPAPQAAAPAPAGAAPGMPPAGQEAGPAETPEEAEPEAQTVGTIKEALTIALHALKNDGQLVDMNGQERAFQEGFSGTGAA